MEITNQQIESMLLVAGEKKAREAMERVWKDMSSAEREHVLNEADLHPERFIAAELAFFQGKREQARREREPEIVVRAGPLDGGGLVRDMDAERLLTEMIEAMETPARVQETRERTWASMTVDERKALLDVVESYPLAFTDGERAFFATKSVDEPTVPRADREPARVYTFQEELGVLSKAGPVALLLTLLGAYAKRTVFGVDVHKAGPAHPEQVRALLSDEAWDMAVSKAKAALRKDMNA